MKKLKGSIRKYDQPFELVGDKDWEALLLEGFTPEMANADELVISTLKERGKAQEKRSKEHFRACSFSIKLLEARFMMTVFTRLGTKEGLEPVRAQ
ncbi:hypothetical protein [Vreelandella zhanjiangensis]|uniref:hypothetical protein n=1 Tax=Vreelandella zhanjiangensis TaxID=1121960 RepID=UPI00035D45F7|nr:hypothetical protein [Halomonas zhanjiangensis]